MIFRPKQKNLNNTNSPVISYENTPLEQVTHFKFLGVTLDETMSWSHHINCVANRISKTNGILSNLKHYLPSHILCTIFSSLIQPHLMYGVASWGFGNCSRIITIQKQAVRNICNAKYNSHTEHFFKQLKILKFTDIFKSVLMKLHFNHSHQKLPEALLKIFSSHQPNSNRPHRTINRPARFIDSSELPPTNNKVTVSLTNMKFTRRRAKHYLPDLIEGEYLPPEITCKIFTHSFQHYCKSMKEFIISTYNKQCISSNCYICASNVGVQ